MTLTIRPDGPKAQGRTRPFWSAPPGKWGQGLPSGGAGDPRGTSDRPRASFRNRHEAHLARTKRVGRHSQRKAGPGGVGASCHRDQELVDLDLTLVADQQDGALPRPAGKRRHRETTAD